MLIVNGCICLNVLIFIQILLKCRKGEKAEILYRILIVKYKIMWLGLILLKCTFAAIWNFRYQWINKFVGVLIITVHSDSYCQIRNSWLVIFRQLIVRVIDITFEGAEPPRRLYQLRVHQFSKCFVSWPNQKLEFPLYLSVSKYFWLCLVLF